MVDDNDGVAQVTPTAGETITMGTLESSMEQSSPCPRLRRGLRSRFPGEFSFLKTLSLGNPDLLGELDRNQEARRQTTEPYCSTRPCQKERASLRPE